MRTTYYNWVHIINIYTCCLFHVIFNDYCSATPCYYDILMKLFVINFAVADIAYSALN